MTGHKKIKIILSSTCCLLLLTGLLLMEISSAFIDRQKQLLLFGKSQQSRVSDTDTTYALSPEVEQYRSAVRFQAEQNGIGNYVDLCMAIMMQESGGKSKDVFQCSESLGLPVNSLDTDASIAQGVKVIATRIAEAGVSNPEDLVNIKTALQGYNFGGAYIRYAKSKDGHWTQDNTDAFAEQKSNGKKRSGKSAERLGIWKYGDQYYTAHVLRYYTFGVVASNDLVKIAEAQLGKDYLWGATGPDKFDCSGLIYYCYKKAGASDLGRLTAAGYYNAATHCSYEELSPGDLVFYNNGVRVHHIAMYIGDGKVIHAPGDGQKVKVSTVKGAGYSTDIIHYGKLN